MNIKVQGYMFLFLLNSFLQSAEDRPLTLQESIIIGGVSGGLEVAATGQILTYGMNQRLIGQPFYWRNMYRGGLINVVGQMPIAAMQKVVQVKGAELIVSAQDDALSQRQLIGVSFGAGVAGSAIDTPSNAIQVFKQMAAHKDKSLVQSCKELGIKGFSRGFAANALLKEGPFAVGYQILAPQAKAVAKKYVHDDLVAEGLGGATAGTFVAIATQPGAVMRGRMQSDPFGLVYTSTWQTAQKICQQEGPAGLLKGLAQRGPRVALAVPMYVFYGDQMKKIIRED